MDHLGHEIAQARKTTVLKQPLVSMIAHLIHRHSIMVTTALHLWHVRIRTQLWVTWPCILLWCVVLLLYWSTILLWRVVFRRYVLLRARNRA